MAQDTDQKQYHTGGWSAHFIMIVCTLLFVVNYMDRQVFSAVLQPMNDFVPLRQYIVWPGASKAEVFGQMDRFVQHVSAIDCNQVPQHFQIEQRDAACWPKVIGR